MISAANTAAEAYSRERVAELLGMKYTDDGLLVTNPDARWAISDTTRDRLRTIVADAFKQEIDSADISTSNPERPCGPSRGQRDLQRGAS